MTAMLEPPKIEPVQPQWSNPIGASTLTTTPQDAEIAGRMATVWLDFTMSG